MYIGQDLYSIQFNFRIYFQGQNIKEEKGEKENSRNCSQLDYHGNIGVAAYISNSVNKSIFVILLCFDQRSI